MSKEDWIACNILHVFVRTFHNLGLLQCIAIYLYYEKKIKYTSFYCELIEWARNNPNTICGEIYYWLDMKYREILNNSGSLTCYDPDFGELTWPLEEGSFLKVIKNYAEFFEEIRPFIKKYITDECMENEILSYQKAVVKNPYSKKSELNLTYDFYKFFSEIYTGKKTELKQNNNVIILHSEEVSEDFVKYARDTVWFGRKGGQNIIAKIEYKD